MLRSATLAALLAFTPAPLLAQGQGAASAGEDDCAFLERSFQEVYAGLREQRRAGNQGQGQGGGTLAQAARQNPAQVTMFVEIQENIIHMHQARGCDVSKLIDLARQEAAQYTNR